MALEFEDILPYVEGEGDTGKTAREKINRNFNKIKPIANIGAEMQQLRQDVADDLEQLHDDVEEMVDKTTSLFGYYNCSTAGATAAKSIQATNYELTNGGNIRIKMEHANTAASPVTLQIGNATAKELYYNGEPVTDENTWESGEIVIVYYDGTNYRSTGKNGNSEEVDRLLGYLNVNEVVSSNLVDPSVMTEGYVASDGSITNNSPTTNYITSDYIEVDTNETYTVIGNKTTSALVARYMCFYNEAKVKVGDMVTDVSEITTFPSGTKYVRATFVNTNVSTTCGIFKNPYISFEPFFKEDHVEYHPPVGNTEKKRDEIATIDDINNALSPINDELARMNSLFDGITGVTELLERVDVVSTNLLDPSEKSSGFLNGNGGVNSSSAGANYDTSKFIPVDGSTLYSFYNLRWIEFYTSAESTAYISSSNKDNGSVGNFTLTSPSTAKYVRVSTSKGQLVMSGIFKGSTYKYESFYFFNRLEYKGNILPNKTDDELVTKKDLSLIGENGMLTMTNDSGTYTITNGKVTISCTFDKNSSDVYGGSHVFNFLSSTNKGVTSIDTDDVAPMHMRGTTLSANHGYTGCEVTITGHGLTSSAIGGVMTDSENRRYIIMRIISTDKLYITNEITSDSDYDTYREPSSTVTYNGSTYSITGEIKAFQMYPSCNNIIHRLRAGGVTYDVGDIPTEIQSGELDFIESYDLMNVRSVQQNISGSNQDYDGDSIIHVDNIYRFLPDMTVLVISNYISTAANDRFRDIMFAQASYKGTGNSVGSSTYYYVPASTPFTYENNAINFANLSAFSNIFGSANLSYFFDSEHTVTGKKVSRILQYNGNSGFVIGYIPVGVGSDLSKTSVPFELRNNSGKIYPHGVDSVGIGKTSLSAGDAYSCVIYRKFLDKTEQKQGRICLYDIDYDGWKYIFIDYSTSMFDHVEVDDSLDGHEVILIDSHNAILSTTVYNGGFYVNATHVSGDSSYCVVKIKL